MTWKNLTFFALHAENFQFFVKYNTKSFIKLNFLSHKLVVLNIRAVIRMKIRQIIKLSSDPGLIFENLKPNSMHYTQVLILYLKVGYLSRGKGTLPRYGL